MGDVSAEPSMEEILSSIKRIIAEEGDTPARAARRAPSRPTPRPDPVDDIDEVLELSEPVTEESPQPRAEAPAAAAPSLESIVSDRVAEAARGPIEALSRMVVKPEVTGSDTLEGLVREMLKPMLREWLDANLPAIVERTVALEIARIAQRNG
jgi:cell pole-organizing protein PopZ